MSINVALIAEGDANTADCWSGSAAKFVESLREAGVVVDVFDAALYALPRYMAAALTYHPKRARWRQRYGLGTIPFFARSRQAALAVTSAARPYDAVIQIGATFSIPSGLRGSTPYVIYCDSNIAYSRRGAPYSAASRLSGREYRSAFDREKRVYDAADRIWTMSDALAESFRTDFAQPSEKIFTIYAGMNNRPTVLANASRQKRILFVGKDHQRKGSQVLLQAFERVRRIVPDAELHLVGPPAGSSHQPSVVCHGTVSRSTESGRKLLDTLFSTSAVFCMPSRYEPFGIAFVEAMSAGLPCVGTNRWAMPEIIQHGETGWLVPDGAVEELADVLIMALRNAPLRDQMGAAARDRALARFTWDRVAATAASDLAALAMASVTVDQSLVIG